MRPLLALALLAAGACKTAQPPAPPSSDVSATDAASALPAGSGELHLLLTTDEHGWLSPYLDPASNAQRGGVVAFFDLVTRIEGYAPTPERRAQGYLLMSSGDMWTGPYETTLLQGAPMLAAMDRMGYAAAAIGNHDFDFGVRVLSERSAQASFPLLAANLIESATGEQPRWARPFAIIAVGGLKLGVIGLTNLDSPTTSDPRHLTGLSFLPYAEALERWVPRARAAGADEVIALIHDELSHAEELMPVLRKHRVRAATFGHHHLSGARIDDGGTVELDDDVVICNAGAFLRSYCRIDMTFSSGTLTSRGVKLAQVERAAGTRPAQEDGALVAIVMDAEKNAQRIGGEVLIESKRVLHRGVSGALGQLVVDSWLKALPWTQVAITNAGGLRQDLAAGPVRVRDVASVLPFNNYLLVVDLTGAQLKEVLANEESVAGGVRYRVSERTGTRVIDKLTFTDGKAITDSARLKVVINDFMYRGGDRYPFARLDPEPEETAIDWREPVLRYLRELGQQQTALDLVADDRLGRR